MVGNRGDKTQPQWTERQQTNADPMANFGHKRPSSKPPIYRRAQLPLIANACSLPPEDIRITNADVPEAEKRDLVVVPLRKA